MSTAALVQHRAAIRWLRASYRAGAILDALAALSMLSPALFAATSGLDDFRPGPDYRYAMGMGASLMLGWTALLLWADRKPLERRGVLLITLFPVVVGLAVNELRAVRAGFLHAALTAPIWLVQALLSVLFLLAYRKSAGVEWEATAQVRDGSDAAPGTR